MEHIQFFLVSDIKATTKALPFAPPTSFSVFYCVINYNMVASSFMDNPSLILPFQFFLSLLISVPSLVFAQLSCNQDGIYERKEENDLNPNSNVTPVHSGLTLLKFSGL
jgi:hypothetical protein